MADVPAPCRSTISNIHRNLFRLEEKMGSDEKVAAEIFQEIKKELSDVESFDISTLRRVETVFSHYSERLPKADKKATKLFFGSKQSTLLEEVGEIKKKVSKTLDKDPIRRKKLIQAELTKWRKLQDDELKHAMRGFIMRACQEKLSTKKGEHIPPCSIEHLFEKIQEQLSEQDDKIKHLLNNPQLFSSYEWKTGACAANPPNISTCLASKQKQGEKTMQTTEEAVNDTIGKIESERDFRLRNLEMVYSKVSEDPSQSVAGKQFEKTSAWYIGSFGLVHSFVHFLSGWLVVNLCKAVSKNLLRDAYQSG